MNERGENLFKALADAQRRQILEMLRHTELSAGEIAARLQLAPATVSYHLNLLKAAELVRMRRDGQQRIYAINMSVVEELVVLLSRLLKPVKGAPT